MVNLTKKHIAIILILSFIIILSSYFAFNIMSKNNIENGIWVNGNHMNDVILDTLNKYGIKNVFLHSSAVNLYGEKAVSNWIKKANNKNITVHIWVQCFYNSSSGKWVNPIDTNKKEFNYPFFNNKIAEIERFAAIPGVGGIQLDYIRYPGNAYKYDYPNGISGSNAVSKFVSMVSDKLNSNEFKDKNLTLSATVMPEKEDTKYYGQDIGTLSQYVDVIVPMAYSGNYAENSNWIKDISSYFKWTATWSNVCVGIQDYGSDDNASSLPKVQLKENCQAALDGGADGVALFNWEFMNNWFDLRELK